jgi:uncharacterized protein YjbJ (UPF0337 family)
MGAADKARNVAQQAKGQFEEDAGKVTGNARLRRKGKKDKLAGSLKQKGERIKDKLSGRR